MLGRYKLPSVPEDAAEAVKLASSIGYPVVMKIVSPQILHKTEAGGVLVGVKSADDVAAGILFLSAPDSVMITGTELTIDGGYTAN